MTVAGSSEYEGKIIAGRYRVERLLGQGGMGSVWAGRHLTLDQLVAIKFIQPGLATSVEALRRFDAAHEQGIVHRDLKPDNVFLARDRDAGALGYVVKLVDFGIAKIVEQTFGRWARARSLRPAVVSRSKGTPSGCSRCALRHCPSLRAWLLGCRRPSTPGSRKPARAR